MTKKVVSVVLVIITLLSTFAITVSAATYSKGTYSISSSAGVNVRSGAGTNYKKVGAAKKGTTFNVTKTSGCWGYTPSIKCTNGTKSGWVSLNYCSYKGSHNNSSRSTYNDVIASKTRSSLSQALSTQSTTFYKNDYIYIWAYLHDANNNLYKTYGSGTCNMKITIYYPDGSVAHTCTYNNSDNNWIGRKLDRAGTWKIQSKITGSLSGTNTRSITVKDVSTPRYYTLTYNANGGSNAPASQRVKENTGFYLSNSKPTRSGYTFLGWSKDKYATSASYAPGAGVKTSSNVTLYAVWKKNATKYYTLTYNANGGSNAPASQRVEENKGFYLSYSKPTRSGYKFLGWSLFKDSTSASYAPGAGVKMSSDITLYAIWEKTVTKTYWKTGYFDSGYTAKGYTTVTLDNKSSNGYIYIYTYDQFGYKTSGQVHVTLRDRYGNWICEFDAKSGDKLKLGNDHEQYRVYIAKKRYPDTVIGDGDDFINVGKCHTWAINCKTNCYIG